MLVGVLQNLSPELQQVRVIDGSEAFFDDLSENLVGDTRYESDSLDAEVSKRGIEMVPPHQRERRHPMTQDGHRKTQEALSVKTGQIKAMPASECRYTGHFVARTPRHSNSLSGVVGTVGLFSKEVTLDQKTTRHYPIQRLAEQTDCAYGHHE